MKLEWNFRFWWIRELHEQLYECNYLTVAWSLQAKFMFYYTGSQLLVRSSMPSHDDDHIDEVRLRLWIAATNGHIIHSPDYIWASRTMVKWYLQKKTPDSSTRALWKSYQQSYLVVNQEEFGEKIMNLAFKVSLFILRSDFLHAVNLTTWGRRLCFLFEGRVLRIFIALKNP
jgi:hypothetical protein